MLETAMIIRDFDPAKDKAAALAFIMGSQHYEHRFEPDRRLDAEVAEEFLPEILKRVAAQRGRIFVADEDGIAIGWAVFTVEQNMLYVVEAERTHGYIAELFVTETARSHGIGRALIAACETEARRQNLRQIMIGVLTKSTRTAEIYARAGYGPYSSELRKYL
jgi:GNAT superfamily N-acetyltransferase